MKIREMRAGDKVKTIMTVCDHRLGNIPIGTFGVVIKVVDGFAPDRTTFDPFYDEWNGTLRKARGHTQILKVKFPDRRIEVLSGAYLARA